MVLLTCSGLFRIAGVVLATPVSETAPFLPHQNSHSCLKTQFSCHLLHVAPLLRPRKGRDLGVEEAIWEPGSKADTHVLSPVHTCRPRLLCYVNAPDAASLSQSSGRPLGVCFSDQTHSLCHLPRMQCQNNSFPLPLKWGFSPHADYSLT